MSKFSTEFFSTHIANDNKNTLGIYNDLVLAYKTSVLSYPAEKNILGVYFIDILKLLTQSFFKKKELELGIEPSHKYVNRSLEAWPYIGYDDIRDGCDIKLKRFGRGSSITQSNLKSLLQFAVNTQYFFGRNPSIKLSVVTPRIDNGSNLLWRQTPDIMTNLVNVKSGWFSVPQLGDQLELLKNLVVEIMEKNHHPISPKLITSLLENHIKADCSEGELNVQFKGDILLLSSGVEIQNRMLAIAAIQQGLPVVNIMHGEAYGVCDEPIFSEFGEQMYSSAILGYGDRVLSAQDTYKFGMKDHVKYIKSNGVNALRHYKPEFSGIGHNPTKVNYFYYPTTMSGATHRYGPYRDTADSLYLLWQKSLFSVFGDLIKIKTHPKEKYKMSFSFSETKIVSGSFDDLLDEIDVFVFDYIGTAFNEACATSKPIIYFDLGIRNI